MAEKGKASKQTDDKLASKSAKMAEDKASQSLHIARQLDQEKIDILSERIEKLLRSNNTLRNGTSKNEKDSHEIALYFKREMEIKDEIIARLNEELIKRDTQLKFEAEKIKNKFDGDLNELRLGTEHIISDLRIKLIATENDLSTFEAYRKARDTYDETLRGLERRLKEEGESKIAALEDQERSFFEEKAHIFKDLDRRKEALREIALKEAKEAMGAEATKILADNHRMYEELKFLHTMTADIEAEKSMLLHQSQSATREVTILTDKELDYARQSHFKSKEINVLRARVEVLEQQHSTNLDRFRTQARELKVTVGKDLEEASVDAAGLRRLLKIKNQELRQMKSLAATILDQRSETEQFFMEALNEVKEAIRMEKKQAADKEKQQMRAAGLTTEGTKMRTSSSLRFPSLIVKRENLHRLDVREPQRPPSSETKVRIKDLSWSDKELVLRVLFAKLNESKQVKEHDTTHNPHDGQRKSLGGLGGLGGNHDRQFESPFFVSEGAGNFLPPGFQGFQDNDREDYDDDNNYNQNSNNNN